MSTWTWIPACAAMTIDAGMTMQLRMQPDDDAMA